MLTDLELLNQVIADYARQLSAGAPSTLNPQPATIKDPAVAFFARQLQADPSLPSVNQTEPPALDI